MPDIRINLDRLESVHTRLTEIVTEFDGTEQFNRAVADATGHAILAAVVGDFANWWNVRRTELTEDLRFIADSAEAIRDTFVELDGVLADRAEAALIEANEN
jgi:predicted LPLAT superfamily acyltransferase